MTNPQCRTGVPPVSPSASSPALSWPWILAIALALWWSNSRRLEPIPVPPTPPTPAAPAWVVVVEQSEQRTPETAKILAAAKFWETLGAKQIQWRVYDYDSKEAVSYRPIADAVGMPTMLFLGPGGRVLLKRKLPATLDELRGMLP